jgi:2-dehydropantoate 2-reductase
MRILIVGAGAIGSFLAVRFARANHQVSVVTRGSHLEAVQMNGLILESSDDRRELAEDVEAYADPREAPASDLIFLTLKAHQLAMVAPSLEAPIAAAEAVVTIQNGLPWWYFQRLQGFHGGRRLRSLDPDGTIARHIDATKLVPCLAFKAAALVAPGVVRHIYSTSDSFPIGELDGTRSGRAMRIADGFAAAGLNAPIVDDIRVQVWVKLLGNVWANPISALTRAPVGAIVRQPETRALAIALMNEVAAVAQELEIKLPASFETRLSRAEQVADAKPSMLQDLERGRPLELDAILGALIELGLLLGVPVPHVSALHSCLALIEARRIAASTPTAD